LKINLPLRMLEEALVRVQKSQTLAYLHVDLQSIAEAKLFDAVANVVSGPPLIALSLRVRDDLLGFVALKAAVVYGRLLQKVTLDCL
jgi:hypothetical protein